MSDSPYSLRLASAVLCFALITGCGKRQPTSPGTEAPAAAPLPKFVNVAASAGIDFVHNHGGSGRKFFPETMAGGCALFDCDEDGDLDLYAVQGAPTPGYQGAPIEGNVLFKNDGTGHFERVPDCGAEDRGYGIGCVTADYDNDGDQDVYVLNYGSNALFQNQGDGTFRNVTEAAGVAGGGVFTSDAAFGDYDLDGDLDLFVANYVVYTWGMEDKWRPADQPLSYGGPPAFVGEPNTLYRNNGDGTFTDVTRSAGLYSQSSKGMDAIWFDYNGDHWPDLFVTNDGGLPDFLYRNDGEGTFTEVATEAGVAYCESGEGTGSMSCCVADLDHDGGPELIVSTYSRQTNILFHYTGDGRFQDATHDAGLAAAGMPFVKWGVALFDYDLDGWADLYVSHGHTFDNAAEVEPGSTYGQPDHLYRNQGQARFQLVSEEAGGWFADSLVGRGLSCGDVDNDGDLDLYVAILNGPGALLRNDTETDHHWLRLKLIGTKSNRDGYGAVVTLRAGKLRQRQESINGAGIFTGSDRRLTFGLGEATTAEEVTIRWPSGEVTKLKDIAADREIVVTEGQ